LVLPIVDVESLDAISDLKQLTHIWIHHVPRLSNIEALSQLPQLENLELADGPVLSDLGPLANLQNLRKLHLSFMPLLVDISALAALTKLQFVTLKDTAVQDCSPLEKLPRLHFRGIDLSGSPCETQTLIRNHAAPLSGGL
jgi:Leucine-rich repeat (LRR) protein